MRMFPETQTKIHAPNTTVPEACQAFYPQKRHTELTIFPWQTAQKVEAQAHSSIIVVRPSRQRRVPVTSQMRAYHLMTGVTITPTNPVGIDRRGGCRDCAHGRKLSGTELEAIPR